ncbi:MAG: hypothetical protein OXI01_06685 [Albidovulum sp.]|nr:hypothetical protein [Albidovulum sp.]
MREAVGKTQSDRAASGACEVEEHYCRKAAQPLLKPPARIQQPPGPKPRIFIIVRRRSAKTNHPPETGPAPNRLHSRPANDLRISAGAVASQTPPAEQRPRSQAAAFAMRDRGRFLPLEILDDLAPFLGASERAIRRPEPERSWLSLLAKKFRLEGTGRGGPGSTLYQDVEV